MEPLQVLLIEDNPADTFLIKEMLNPAGIKNYTINHSGFLKDALLKLENNSYDIILSDLGLPDSSGLETINATLKLAANIPIIVLTGTDDDQLGNDAMSIGAQDYLIKGQISSDQLLRSIRYAFHRKKSEIKLRESEEKFRSIVETSPDAVITCNTDATIIYASQRAANLFGFKNKEQMLGVSLYEFFTPDYKEKAKLTTQKTIKKGITRDVEYLLLKQNGDSFYGEISSSMVKNTHENGEGFICITKDIGDRKNAEKVIKAYQQNLRSMASELNLAEEKERRRIAVKLHDHLGQNLALAKIKVSSLKKTGFSPQILDEIKDAEEHISHVIKNSRILTYELSPPVLFELGLSEAISWKLDQISESYGIKVNLEMETEIPALKEDIQIMLFRSVSDLLNSISLNSGINYLNVKIGMVGNSLNITVNDGGEGVFLEDIKKNIQTNGVGLFSIKERLEYFDGHLKIKSKVGKKTKINLSVPVN